MMFRKGDPPLRRINPAPAGNGTSNLGTVNIGAAAKASGVSAKMIRAHGKAPGILSWGRG